METTSFTLVAGHVALDMINTLDNRWLPERTVDLLNTYGNLLRFCEQTGVVRPSRARELRRAATSREAEAALRQATDLRETVFRIFTAVATDAKIPASDLTALNEQLASASVHRQLQRVDGAFQWVWKDAGSNLESPLWPIAFAASELLVSEDLALVRECGAEACRWLFLDLSKNHRRRWCNMKTCGNRSKARRYYQKHADEQS